MSIKYKKRKFYRNRRYSPHIWDILMEVSTSGYITYEISNEDLQPDDYMCETGRKLPALPGDTWYRYEIERDTLPDYDVMYEYTDDKYEIDRDTSEFSITSVYKHKVKYNHWLYRNNPSKRRKHV